MNTAAERQYVEDAKALEHSAFRRLSSTSRRLLAEAESQARVRDDDHVGTEHIVLAVYAFEATAASRSLAALGVTREIFDLQLHTEPGPSPRGRIPLTPRARMIVCLASVEADRSRSEEVEPAHILLGVIRESERWEATGIDGPRHLRAAVSAAGTTLSALEQTLIREMGLRE
jgi:ATP-dependent Clp protease ATP-binding subunit ClpA